MFALSLAPVSEKALLFTWVESEGGREYRCGKFSIVGGNPLVVSTYVCVCM